MKKIYSKVNPKILLHVVNYMYEVGKGAIWMTEPEEFQQAACYHMGSDSKFEPHRHCYKPRQAERTQEAFVVVKGKVIATLYDLDKTCLESVVLRAGDCVVTLHGGHAFSVEAGSIFYEFKNGPYQGAGDKEYFDG